MAAVSLSETAARRIRDIVAKDPSFQGVRLAVSGGGCSGFQYDIALAAGPAADDLVVERDGAHLFVDPVGIELIEGSILDWEDALIGASFKVKNPNAKSACGCGISFSV